MENSKSIHYKPIKVSLHRFGCYRFWEITHVARHTFASVVALVNNVSLENVAKMLGHSNTKMTQHYAKVMDSSILRDMKKVDEKMGNSI